MRWLGKRKGKVWDRNVQEWGQESEMVGARKEQGWGTGKKVVWVQDGEKLGDKKVRG